MTLTSYTLFTTAGAFAAATQTARDATREGKPARTSGGRVRAVLNRFVGLLQAAAMTGAAPVRR